MPSTHCEKNSSPPCSERFKKEFLSSSISASRKWCATKRRSVCRCFARPIKSSEDLPNADVTGNAMPSTHCEKNSSPPCSERFKKEFLSEDLPNADVTGNAMP